MIPVKIDEKEYDYSDFQPDQILTADNLNHLFNFLDLQERLTRTNLIGIGIVCGLWPSKLLDGTISITKGTCVTSHGYLMAHGIENSEDPVIYDRYRNFNALEENRYPVFVDLNSNTQLYPLWELLEKKDLASTGTKLTSNFLDNKVCLFFYEMLEIDAKNCDPTSCDDKGTKVVITIRKLLVNENDATAIIQKCNAKANASGSGELFPGLFTLPEVRLPRFDVLATTLDTTNEIYEAYQKVFTKNFVESTGNALKKAYDAFKPLLKTSTNVFDTFNTQFAFLHNGTISSNNLLHFQYYYDFFYDLIIAYQEWRDTAHSIAAMCTPPEALFPRHVFLGDFKEAIAEKNKYRNYFIPSPILHSCCHTYQEFRSLFIRMVRLITNVSMPVPVSSGKTIDSNIRITPSLLGKFPLGQRAIPYYYKPNDGSPRLFEVWNHDLTVRGKEKLILNYNPIYNTTDDFVKNPLLYDVEPYNFFRVEGHIGKKFESALASILDIRNKHRLPFDVVALTVDSLTGKINPADFPCHFIELESQYEILRAELMCTLCKVIDCLYKQPLRLRLITDKAPKRMVSKLKLIKECKEELTYDDRSVGVVYDTIHPKLLKLKDNFGMVEMIKEIRLIGAIEENGKVVPNDEAVVTITQIIQAIVALAESFAPDLITYSHDKVMAALANLKKLLEQIAKDDNLSERFKNRECLNDLYDLCDLAQFAALYKEYLSRIAKLKEMQSLKEFSKHHPGIQHKGGVPTGGTFILVYRDLESDTPIIKEAAPIAVDIVAAPIAVSAISMEAAAPVASMMVVDPSKPIKKLSAKQKLVAAKNVSLMRAKGMVAAEIESVLGIGILELLKEKGIFDKVVDQYEHGMVIADFYLPYLCCSDCPPIHFTVNIPPPKIIFSLDKPEYCVEDTEEYFFLASPVDGVVTSSEGQENTFAKKDNGTFVFLPSKATIPAAQQHVNISFTYAAEGLAQSISVKVYRKPEVTIVAKPSPANPLLFEIGLDKPERVTSASWSFGDNTFSNEVTPPPHVYIVGGEYTVKVEVKNGVCTAKPEAVTVKAQNPDPVEVDLKQNEICQIVKTLQFSITPVGGTLTGESFSESPEERGKYTFSPSDVDLKGLSKRSLVFNYVSPQNQTKTFTITVFAKPEGIAQANTEGNFRVKVYFSELKNVSQIKVDFGDGTGDVYDFTGLYKLETPPHQYAQKGAYTIRTTLINGPCATELKEIVVEVTGGEVQPMEKVCPPIEDLPETYKEIKAQLAEVSIFKEVYKQQAPELEAFIKSLSKAVDGNGNADPKFFDKEMIQPNWISVLPLAPAVARSLSIEIMFMLINILITAACVGKGDIDGRMIEVFSALMKKLEEMKTLNAADKKLLELLIDKMRQELQNIRTNGEESLKKNYADQLNVLIEMIKKILKSA